MTRKRSVGKNVRLQSGLGRRTSFFFSWSASHADSASRFAPSAFSSSRAAATVLESFGVSNKNTSCTETMTRSLSRLRHGTLTRTRPRRPSATATGRSSASKADSRRPRLCSVKSPPRASSRKLSALMPATKVPSRRSRSSATAFLTQSSKPPMLIFNEKSLAGLRRRARPRTQTY